MIRVTFPGILILAFSSLAWGQPQIPSVVNSASFETGLPAGGALATLFVSGVSGSPGIHTAPPGQALPLSLAGIQISVNSAFAPILAVIIPPSGSSGYTQINFQVPMERNASPSANSFLGNFSVFGPSPGISVPVPSLPEWGGFFSSGSGYAAALHASDRSLVTTQNPAHPGEPIIAYGDDLYAVWPATPMAIPIPTQPTFELANLPSRGEPGNIYLQTYPTPGPSFPTGATVSCTNTPALQVSFEGLAAGMVGVEEIDFVVPANQTPGNWALFFNIGSSSDGSGCNGNSASSSPYVLVPIA